MSFRIAPLSPSTAAHLRETATVVCVADESPGYPCRVCLRDAAVGEEVVLVSHDPFGDWDSAESSPYRSASAIYLHRRDCSADLDPDPVPDQLVRRRLSVRAFDEQAMMLDGRVVDGVDLAALLDELAAMPGVVKVFVHNAAPGCFAASVELTGG